jgi:hypothetical protein
MTTPSETQRFLQLFAELDGDTRSPRHEVTLACIDALLDRLVNPPMLDTEYPEVADVDGAERTVIGLVTEEADRLREFIRSHPPPEDPT